MPLGREIDLSPGDIVLDRDPAAYERGTAPNFRHMDVVSCGWIKMPLGTEVGLGPGHFVLNEDPTPHEKGTAPPLFRPCLLWPNV